MKRTGKLLVALLAVVILLTSMTALTASAATTPKTLYLTPNSNWKQSNARFAAYFFGNGEKWVSMTDSDKDGVYEVEVPAGYPNVIFCRMNPSASANNWNNKWNQTGDLVIPTSGANHYTVKAGTWDKGGGTWSTFGSTCAHTNLGPAATCTTAQVCLDCKDPVVSALGHTFNSSHLCTRCNTQASFTVAGSGAHLGTEWDTGNTANDMTYADGVYTKVYENVKKGNYMLKVARDHDWGTAYPSADKAYTVPANGCKVTVTLKGTEVTIDVECPHNNLGSEATCTEPQVCTDCKAVIVPALGHKEEVDEAVAPTCTETGLTEGKHCSVCDAVLVAQEVVDALGHRIENAPAVKPTCTEAGHTGYQECVREGCDYESFSAQLKPLGHTEVVDEAVAPTCTETGLTEGKHCSVCGEVLVAQEVVDALGHDMVDDKAVAPSCTETGLTAGEHCTRCDHKVAQEEVPALGHDMIVDAAVAPSCTETGLTEGSHCSRCDHVVAQEVVDALGHDMIVDAAVAPSCT